MKLNELSIPYGSLDCELLDRLKFSSFGVVFLINDGFFCGNLVFEEITFPLENGHLRKISSNNQFSLQENYSRELVKNIFEQCNQDVLPVITNDNVLIDFVVRWHDHIPVLEPELSGNEAKYLNQCIETNWISSQGKFVTKFEESISRYTNSNYVLAVSNGTVALHLALVSLGIGAGDEVIVPNITFGATLNAVILSGASPVIVDVDSKNWSISIELIKKNITKNTKAILPVHIYGVPCNMSRIVEIAKQKKLLIIEDCAEALGASINSKHVGTFGDIGTLSFFGNKVITCGEGGALLFKDKKIYDKAKILRDHGMSPTKRYWHEEVGFNYRLTNMQAAVGVAQFEKLGDFKKARINIYNLYRKYIAITNYFEEQVIEDGYDSSYWLYTMTLKKHVSISRDELISQMYNNGIDTRPMFYPMSVMPAFSSCKNYLNGVSICVARRGISLPTSVTLDEGSIKRICKTMIRIIDKFQKLDGSSLNDK